VAADVPAERADATPGGTRLQEPLHRRSGRDPHLDDRLFPTGSGRDRAERAPALGHTHGGPPGGRGPDRRAGGAERRAVTGPLLEITDLTIRFGGLVAVDGLDLRVNAGEIVGLIGPNGAGKTTVFNCISRFYQPDRGTIRFKGRDITSSRSHEIIRFGIARTFQNV